MGNRPSKTAILLLTHLKNKNITEQFARIDRECSGKYDVFILCDNSNRTFDRYGKDKKFFPFDVSRLSTLGYPGKSSVENLRRTRQGDRHHQRFHFDPGNVDLPVLLFFKEHPGYDYYWTVEYDVRFTGAWDAFFSSFEASDADLLGTTLTRHEKIPTWYHWPSLDLRGKPIGKDRYLRGFFPIYRISRRALMQLDRDYRDGVKGHYECLVPTLLNDAGMSIEDIGGDGDFVRPANRNRFYRNTPSRGSLSPGTFVFRPVMDDPGTEPNMLWHPVRRRPQWRIVLSSLRRTVLDGLRRAAGRPAVPVATRTGDSPG